MRQKSDAVLCFEWSDDDSLLKIVRDRRREYKGLSEILDQNPSILALAHRDLQALSQGGRKGRRADFTSENLLRALLVHQIEGESLRETVIRIAESPFLQDFLRLGDRTVMDFTFLDRAFNAIRPETWKRINEVLARDARERKLIDPSAIRVDTTVVETTIHYPTDSSLTWDSWRVLSRLLKQGRELSQALCPHRFHSRKVKRLYQHITRYATSHDESRQREVKAWWRKLIERVQWIARVAEEFLVRSLRHPDLEVQAVGDEIARLLPLVCVVLSTAERAQLKGEKVPASERVFSLFEPHTELIKRGKARKPVEFGHAVMFSQTREKFITDYEVMEHRVSDSALAEVCVDHHERLFGEPPEGLTADMGFNPGAEVREALEERVGTLAIPRRLSDWKALIGSLWQRFRAGIEGTISVLKRAYRLLRCPYRGFKNFASSVGLSVFCHNLVLLADRPGG
jgi:IS5 family transposase